jgi:hypothetical protein
MKRFSLLAAFVCLALLIGFAASVALADDEKKAEDPPIKPSRSIGFGFGIYAPGDDDAWPFSMGGTALMRYWAMDVLALEPKLKLMYASTDDRQAETQDATFVINPELVLLGAPLRGKNTRFEIGGGLGIIYEAVAHEDTSGKQDLREATDTIGVTLPVEMGVEHFFAQWFSINVGVEFNLLSYETSKTKTEEGNHSDTTKPVSTVAFDIDSANLFLNLIFYAK